MQTNDQSSLISRRHWITRIAGGTASWALLDLLQREGRAELLNAGASPITNPFAPKPQNFPARAKSVIFLMMAGGPSQMETFDPKPLLNKLAGELMPASFGKIPAQFTDVTKQPLLGCKLARRAFRFPRRFRISRDTPTSWRSFAVVTTTRSIIRRRNMSSRPASRAWAFPASARG